MNRRKTRRGGEEGKTINLGFLSSGKRPSGKTAKKKGGRSKSNGKPRGEIPFHKEERLLGKEGVQRIWYSSHHSKEGERENRTPFEERRVS